MAKLGHPEGEVNLTRGAGNTGIIQVASISSPYYFEHDLISLF